jgi:hemerythrin-like domain-containing protein
MRPHALDIIRDEHRALAGMLVALRTLVRDARDRGIRPDFEVLRALLYYVHAFPERLHHPKETDLLFPALRARSGALSETLARLDADHAHGEAGLMKLAMQLIEYEQLGPAGGAAFAAAIEQYVDAYLRHMEAEEREVLPAAERTLTPEDWATIDAAFAANRDPLTGHAPEAQFEALFRRIVTLAPAPIGLGRPMH